MIEIVDIDYEYARTAMNAIWGICQKLHKRRISVFDAVQECGDEYNNCLTKMLLNKGEDDGEM